MGFLALAQADAGIMNNIAERAASRGGGMVERKTVREGHWAMEAQPASSMFLQGHPPQWRRVLHRQRLMVVTVAVASSEQRDGTLLPAAKPMVTGPSICANDTFALHHCETRDIIASIAYHLCTVVAFSLPSACCVIDLSISRHVSGASTSLFPT